MSQALSLFLKPPCPLLRFRIPSVGRVHILLTDSPRINRMIRMHSSHTPQDRPGTTASPVLPVWASITLRGTHSLSQDLSLKCPGTPTHMHLPLHGLTTSPTTPLPSPLPPTSHPRTLSLSLEATRENQALSRDHFLNHTLGPLEPHVHMTTTVSHQTPQAHRLTPTHRLLLLLGPVG